MGKKGLVIRIAGESGEGIVSAGEILARTLVRSGWEAFTFQTYPAEIRGGQSIFQVRVDSAPLLSHGDKVDLLVAFDNTAYEENFRDLVGGGIVVHDSFEIRDKKNGTIYYMVPMGDIASKEIHRLQSKNMVALGALAQILNISYQTIEGVIQERLGKKGTEVIEKNLLALKAGYLYAEREVKKVDPHSLPTREGEKKMLLSGNEAIAIGAVIAGCRFFAGYPITPATEIMEWLARELPKFGGVVMQAEDEISALGMAIGASYAGKKALTATSGPGLSLMTEMLGLASMAEIPVVVVDVQRAGPSTGMPTKTEQSDLDLALYGQHGEGPRIVIAPTSVLDCLYQTINAFNLSERYQVPVIILSDQSLGQRKESIPVPFLKGVRIEERLRPDEGELKDYRRYRITPNGISPMAIPGMDMGWHVAQGIEHDEYCLPDYSPENRQRMMMKRLKKIEAAAQHIANLREEGGVLNGMERDLLTYSVRRYGSLEAEVGIIGWGSTEGAVREAMEIAQAEGISVSTIYPRILNPLPDKDIKEFINSVNKIIIPEVNCTGQFARLINERYQVQAIQLNSCKGLPFTPAEILNKIKEVASHAKVFTLRV